MNRMKPKNAGFTLTELAIVMIIMALLIGGMMVPLSVQRELQNSRETQKQLADISDALIGYAASHQATDGKPYLPCPDTDDDGLENRLVDNTCSNLEGRLPWGDLGVGGTDAWGNRFRYRVVAAYSSKVAGFALGQAASLRICEDSTCTKVVANDLPVVIVSHGRNGAGAFNTSGGTNPAPVGADEISNQDGNVDFVLRTPSDAAGSEFDDLAAWISRFVLFNRMIAAGKLP